MKYCTLRDMYASSIVMGCMRIVDKPLEQVEKVMVEAMGAGVRSIRRFAHSPTNDTLSVC